MQIKSAKDLIVYQKAYSLAMEIFEISKTFPKEEKYAYPVKYYDFTLLRNHQFISRDGLVK